MKKIYLLIGIICMTTIYTHCQNTETSPVSQNNGIWRNRVNLGIKIGTNYSNVYDTEGENFKTDPKFGLATGLFLAIPIGEVLGIQPEILYSQKGYKADGRLLDRDYEITRTSNYLDVPIYFVIKPAEFLSIMAGPQYSYLISQKNKFENGRTTIEQEEEFDNENLRKNTFCFLIGADLNMEQFVIGGRIGWDFYKNNGDGTTTTPRYKNIWYQLTLGLRF